METLPAPAATATKPVRFVIVHAKTLTAQAIAGIIERDAMFACVGTIPEADAAALRAMHPDLVVLDKDEQPALLRHDIETISRAVPSAQICILSEYEDIDLVQDALRAGADGYFLKDSSAQRLLEGLHAVYDNKLYIDERLSRALLTMTRDGGSGETALSKREREICRFVARGSTNRRIAESLNVSENTVKNHMSSILSKLHLQSRTQVVVYAMRRGWH